MISDKGVSELLTTLLENRFESLTHNEITSQTGKSTSWFFLNAKKLKRLGYIKRSNSLYQLDFGNHCVWHLLQAFGWNRVYQLEGPHKDNILHIFEELRTKFEKDLRTVLLTGSLAYGAYDAQSDVDLLVVLKQRPNVIDIDTKAKANIIVLSIREFQDRYLAGDDFVLSALRYGWPLLDNYFIRTYYRRELPDTPLKEIIENRRTGKRIIQRIYDLAEVGDLKKLRENYHSLLVHVGRQLLLKQGKLPGPHRELSKQFSDSDPFTEFYEQNRNVGDLNEDKILQGTRYLAGLL